MDISLLERAAETLLAPPTAVSGDDRRQAENFFQELKKSISISEVVQIIQQTRNSFVLFQMAQAAGELMLRDWTILEQSTIERTYKNFVEFVATEESLEHFVVAEFLKSIAVIIKRGILDGKTGDQEEIYKLIHNLLMQQSPRLQTLGCRFISALIEQFSSAWRNSKFSITWDFHLKAKTEFENSGLRKLLEFSLTTIHALNNQRNIFADEFTRRLCEKFLEVAENIFSWNFSSKIFRRFLSVNTLHSKIRIDEDLSLKSMNCLVQLASVTGDCMQVENTELCRKYVALYVKSLLDLFAEGPVGWEVNNFCTIINRLFLFRPLGSIMRLEPELRDAFFKFLTEYTLHLTRESMNKAIGTGDHAEHTSLALVYDSLVVLLRGRWRTFIDTDEEEKLIEQQYIAAPTLAIVKQFVQCVLAPPKGIRPPTHEEDDIDGNEDRVLFNDLLAPLSNMICYNTNDFVQLMTATLRGTFVELTTMAQTNNLCGLPNWQEDQHWLMLILANSVVGEEMDGACHMAGEVLESSTAFKNANPNLNPNTKVEFLKLCIEKPTEDRSAYDQSVEPFLLLTGELLAWGALEHQLFTNASREMISPELCRSTLFALKRFLNAASCAVSEEVAWLRDDGDDDEDGDVLQDGEQTVQMLPTDESFVQTIIEFVIHKVFTLIANFSGEEKLCKDAIDLLVGIVESYSSVIASSNVFFEYLGNFDIARIPNRTSLMRALVIIGASTKDAQLQENMFNSILMPLSERFFAQCAAPSTSDVDSQIVDILQCFDGVARGSTSVSALVLFRFLHPVLVQCVSLMRSRAHSQSVVSAILELLLDATTKVSIYVDEKDETNKLYSTLLEIVDCYRMDQVKRFQTMREGDEDKAGDLTLFIEILSNVLSKDILETGEDRVTTGAKVAMASLEMLLTIMNEEVLQIPEFTVRFYRLILYLVEFSPEAMNVMTPSFLGSLCECIKLGMSGRFGLEITSTSLETLTEVIFYFSMGDNRNGVTPELAAQFQAMLPIIFETCLENTCETSIYSEACSALYSLICFDRGVFDVFVASLLAKKSNEAAALVLREAFNELAPSGPLLGQRRERILFRARMETFIGKIQGLLSYN